MDEVKGINQWNECISIDCVRIRMDKSRKITFDFYCTTAEHKTMGSIFGSDYI